MTAYVRTPEGMRAGSGVIEVRLGGDIKQLGWMGTGGHFVAGEAIPVDLPRGQILWVLLANDWQDGSDWAASALPGSLPESNAKEEELPVIIRSSWSPRPLQRMLKMPWEDRDNYPYFVRFKRPGNPLSLEIVDPDDVAASFGAGFALDHITVQYTDEPVSRRIDKRLTPGFFDRWTQLLDRFSGCGDVDHPFLRRPAFTVRSTAFSQPIDTVPGDSRDLDDVESAQAPYRIIPCNRLIPGFKGDTVRRFTGKPVFTHHIDEDAAKGPVAFAEWTPGAVRLDSNYLGTLSLTDGCLTMDSSNPMLLVFPRGEARWDDRRRVLTFRNKHYRIGDKIDLLGDSHYLYVDGGKVAYPQDARQLGEFAFKKCNGFDLWLVK